MKRVKRDIKTISLHLDAAVKEQLDERFNTTYKWGDSAEDLFTQQVMRIARDEYRQISGIDFTQRPSVQSAINTWIVIGLREYELAIARAKEDVHYSENVMKNAYCRPCAVRVMSVSDKCPTCDDYVVMDGGVS